MRVCLPSPRTLPAALRCRAWPAHALGRPAQAFVAASGEAGLVLVSTGTTVILSAAPLHRSWLQ